MSLLFRILYAAHASGTHHKLALDALRELDGARAEDWRRLFLANAEIYLKGSKAPDNEFKDFKNHVLHVRDGYWGGAAEQAKVWYDRFIAELRAGHWPEAAYAAGVLGHYYTDPVHPFHTGQSEAENNVHRAVEWSISRSYDALRRLGEAQFASTGPVPEHSESWLRDFVAAGADTSNRYYEALMAHYDLSRGVADPPSGLDPVGQQIVAGLIIYASRGLSRVLERAIAEAGVAPPQVSLTAETVLAGLKIPLKFVTKKLDDAADRREVERMYDELKATGRVEQTLGEAERVVRDLHAAEVVAPLAESRRLARNKFVSGREETPDPAETLRRVAAAMSLATAKPSAEAPPPAVPDARPAQPKALATLTDIRERSAQLTSLAPGEDVERAPSIGPKTAARLYALQIKTVADLLAADPARTADALDTRHINAQVIADWQDQARLMIDVPGLRGTHAQLLVGAGFRSRDALAAAEPDTLCARVLAFAASTEGKRVLREGNAPDIDRIAGWLASARGAAAA